MVVGAEEVGNCSVDGVCVPSSIGLGTYVNVLVNWIHLNVLLRTPGGVAVAERTANGDPNKHTRTHTHTLSFVNWLIAFKFQSVYIKELLGVR